MADCFVVFYYLHGKFVDCIIRLLFCMKFFTHCGFPNIFIHMVSPNSWVESRFLHVGTAIAQTINMYYWPNTRSRWLDIGMAEFSFCVFMDRDEVEVHKNAKGEQGQYLAILIELAWSIKDLLYGIKSTEKMIFVLVYFQALKRKPVMQKW